MWELGKRYRGRGVSGEIALKMIESTGTKYVEAVIESTLGPMLGQRIRWRGYVNTETNVQTTVAELRVMGWRGKRLGDWAGFGSSECEFTPLADDGLDKNGKPMRFYRAAFVRTPARINDKGMASARQVDDVNAEFAHLFSGNGTESATTVDADEATTVDADEADVSFP